MVRRMRVALSLLVFASFLLPGCGQPSGSLQLWKSSTISHAKERGKLIVALEAEFEPFEYIDKNGELVGFDVDLARILGDEMDISVEFTNISFEGIIDTLLSKKCDLIISGMTATPKRALRVSYSEPYFHTVTCLLVSKKRGADIKSIADLNHEDRIVAVKQQTTGEAAAQRRCPNAKIVSYGKEDDAALEVAFGRADAFLYDLRAVQNHHARHPDTTFLLLEPVTVEPYAIACRKGDPDTVAWLNLVLHHLKRDGRLKELYAKYRLENVELGD